MSTTCKYCNEPENKQERPGLICDTCICFVHLDCLRRQSTPGDFVGDIFFEFTCADCSPNSEEKFKRKRFAWIIALLITINHLTMQMQAISNNGFFHYKTHICSFVDRNWAQLFDESFKKKKNWVGTIAGVLSVHNNLFFRSGSQVLGEQGWWQLLHSFSPAVIAHILQEVSRDKPRGGGVRSKSSMFTLDKAAFVKKVTEMGYQEYLFKPHNALTITATPPKKRRLDTDRSAVSTSSVSEPFDAEMRKEFLDNLDKDHSMYLTARDNYADVDSIFGGLQYLPSYVAPSETSSLHSNSSHNNNEFQSDDEKMKKHDVKPKKIDEKPAVRPISLFSTIPNTSDLPWIEKEPEEKQMDLVPMTEYQEIQLLKNVENLIPKVRDLDKKADLCRLKAKLTLRRRKRHKHLPVFDLDKTVRLLGGYVTEDQTTVMNTERVLDRFQRSYLIDNLCGTISSTSYGTLLLSRIEPTVFRSSYSGAMLKPYIRRDYTIQPLWLKLMDELLRKTHSHVADYTPPARPSVDFSYVRPQHIAAVNALCAQFFWPGIDLTEALQYPEFSCVVTYGRLVVACAFLVPDARGEAYVSFVLARPEWRRRGLASFMLYHLLQTCTDKDVTLHVSPTNPAIFLYQKFGFKVEELVQDFYEKYYDSDYKGCRHALFLRLVR